MLLTALLLACTTPPPAAPPFADGLSSDMAKACFEASCAGAPEAQTCFDANCPERSEAIALVPEKVRWDPDEGLFFLEAHVDYTAPAFGEIEAKREDPLFIGVTLITPQGEELDLAIATRFPGAFDEPFFITSEVDKEVQDVIVGVWDRKIEPCESERPGCKEFGFLLDGPLASWPPEFYGRFEAQRLPPAVLTIRGVAAGARVEDVAKASAVAAQTLTEVLKPFGTTVEAAPPILADSAATDTQIRCQHTHDKAIARIAAGALGDGWGCCEHLPELDADVLELVVAGDAAHLACLAEHCAEADDLTACESTSCP